MKVNKTQALLYMLLVLIEKGQFSKVEVLQEVDISEQTFRRYVQELRAFLSNFNTGSNLIYTRGEDKYFLVK